MATATISHNFNNDANTDISLSSSDNRVSVISRNKNYEGASGIKAGEEGAKHYLITISNFTASSSSDITISITNNRPAAASPGGIPGGDDGVGLVYLAKVELVSGTSNQFTVWFGNNNDDQYPNSASFVKEWSVTWSANISNNESRTAGASSCPDPVSWSSLLPTCGSPPTGLSSSDGLQISKTGNNQITLNLKNYANKLVTLRITHSTSANWTQSFDFSIPTCSDLSPNTGGSPYARSPYSNSNISGTNIFIAYNVDGGNYNYVFNHSSVPGPRPTRTNYNLVCTPSTSVETSTNADGDTVTTDVTTTTCVCEPYTETYTGQWPHCPTGVAVSKNGGEKVQWQYEDGGGGNYEDQYVTVDVLDVREAVKTSGKLCVSEIKNAVWIADSNNTPRVGNCIGDYKDHSTALTEKRFRSPATQTSLNELPTPVCFASFRGLAGAKTPSELGF